MKKVLVDTNILLNGFELEEGYTYVLLSHINRELDKHKVHGDNELKFKLDKQCDLLKKILNTLNSILKTIM